jgi:hypothetical protein
MSKTIRLSAALVLTCVAFVAGAWTAIQRGWGADTVTAQIINVSDQSVDSIAIQFESCGSRGSVVSGELKPGSSRRLRYSVCGEGGYTVEAVFADGHMVRSRRGYVETGYLSTDKVSIDAIISEQSLF